MALGTNRLAAASALAAALSMAATPAAAIGLPGPAGETRIHDGDMASAYHRRHRHHRGGGVDAGDILAGVLILGGIAAVASAASQSGDRQERYPEREPYPSRPDYNRAGNASGPQTRGLDNAMDICVAEIQRGGERVSSVESAARTGDGWNVGGILQGGANFSCWIGNDGRIRDVTVQDRYGADEYGVRSHDRDRYGSNGDDRSADRAGDNQWSDDYYNRARDRLRYSTPDLAPAGQGGIDGDLDAPERF
ncbi:hypothetical protein [Croceibacterium atlanticum]|nr:hypothetical protein [Croceibacterium atlanticum]